MSVSTDLEALFAPLEQAEGGWVVGQLGQSLDGRIATASGHSHYINGPEDIRRLHRLRALCDAVVVGAGTVAADDPRLTVRHVEGVDPVRVVLDPGGRLPADRRLFTDGAAPTLRLVAEGRAGGEVEEPRGEGGRREGGSPRAAGPLGGDAAGDPPHRVRTIALPADPTFDPHAIVAVLRERGLNRILVEGGGRTVSAFLQAGALDRLHLSIAALLIGSGRPSITLPEIRTLDEAIRPEVHHYRVGTDLVFDVVLKPGTRGTTAQGSDDTRTSTP